VAERPDKPQVHYLLGYLRYEEENYSGAFTNFQAATRLDPDYLNAWLKLSELLEHVPATPDQRNEIAFNILRLDPMRRHGGPDYRRVTDLAGLWKAEDEAIQRQPVQQTNLFTLTASKEALGKVKATNPRENSYFFENAFNRVPSPGAALAETPFVQFAGQMILDFSFGIDE
jgi:hypothetical protein